MAVLKDFYQITDTRCVDDKYSVQLSLNPEHEIYQGHFPGNPVVPGVCMMQIIKDISEKITERKLFLTSANNVKFMAIINPETDPDLTLELIISQDGDQVKVKNTTSFGETLALKLSVNYKTV